MSYDASGADHVEVRSSRVWALLTGRFTRLLFPARLVADHVGISTTLVEFWLTPWRRTDEHLPLSHIAEVAHMRGLIWDRISIESSGGLNPLVVAGLPKRPAQLFVDRVRARLHATGARRSKRASEQGSETPGPYAAE